MSFTGSCLKQVKNNFNPRNVVNIFIVYESDVWSQDLKADFDPRDCLFGAMKLTKNTNSDKYSYSGYGT